MADTPRKPTREMPGTSAKLRVLVVDDHTPVRDAIAGLLSARGFETVAADSGAAALEHIRAEYFDVLLCDVLMPNMSGIEVLTAALEIDRGLPVLMLTAVNDQATARQALERGAMDYLTKPIEMDELEQAVLSAANYRRHEIKRRSGPHRAIPDGAIESRKLELHGGPMAGQRVSLEDTRLQLWVVRHPDGEQTWASPEAPNDLAPGSLILGSYSYPNSGDVMIWMERSPS